MLFKHKPIKYSGYYSVYLHNCAVSLIKYSLKYDLNEF